MCVKSVMEIRWIDEWSIYLSISYLDPTLGTPGRIHIHTNQ